MFPELAHHQVGLVLASEQHTELSVSTVEAIAMTQKIQSQVRKSVYYRLHGVVVLPPGFERTM
jgi:hypothetical protein